MAKLTRESRLRERRLDKQARKDARKLAAAQDADRPDDELNILTGESTSAVADDPAVESVDETLTDA